ncbi:MAG: ribosome biogenesis GTPase Der [Polyangiaceae bacterium]|nr:ribosome biogenesis GTPase Der [Polyangiaceae bacterium]
MTKHFPHSPQKKLPGGSYGLPIVAVVGRPNVGKSTLFNRLARKRLALVHDEPGVTRDRHFADTSAFGRDYTLVDTGGFDPDDDDPMKSGIAEHVRSAIAEADIVVFVTDAQHPLLASDREAIKLLRRSNKPCFYVANKADSPKDDPGAMELYKFGVKNVYCVSALHGRGVGDLEAEIVKAFPAPVEELADGEEPTRVAIVGKPNAGKSSLLNRVLGKNRMLVDSRPGTTRDAIDSVVERNDKKYVLVDTAGIRKKSKVTKGDDAVEQLSVTSSVRAIERCDIAVLVADAHEGVAEQDAKILGLAHDRHKAIIVALNKCDLMDGKEIAKSIEQAKDKLSFANHAVMVTISAKTGRGVADLFRTVDDLYTQYYKRITTGELNRFFKEVLDERSPPTSGGKAPRLYFITQVDIAPPTFVVVASAPDSVHFSYRRFVVNQLRKRFEFTGVPVRVHYRSKRKSDNNPNAPKEFLARPRPPKKTS